MRDFKLTLFLVVLFIATASTQEEFCSADQNLVCGSCTEIFKCQSDGSGGFTVSKLGNCPGTDVCDNEFGPGDCQSPSSVEGSICIATTSTISPTATTSRESEPTTDTSIDTSITPEDPDSFCTSTLDLTCFTCSKLARCVPAADGFTTQYIGDCFDGEICDNSIAPGLCFLPSPSLDSVCLLETTPSLTSTTSSFSSSFSASSIESSASPSTTGPTSSSPASSESSTSIDSSSSGSTADPSSSSSPESSASTVEPTSSSPASSESSTSIDSSSSGSTADPSSSSSPESSVSTVEPTSSSPVSSESSTNIDSSSSGSTVDSSSSSSPESSASTVEPTSSSPASSESSTSIDSSSSGSTADPSSSSSPESSVSTVEPTSSSPASSESSTSIDSSSSDSTAEPSSTSFPESSTSSFSFSSELSTSEGTCPSCGFREDEDDGSCQGYIECRDGSDNSLFCGEGECFDPDNCLCVPSDVSSTSAPISTTTEPSTEVGSCPVCGYKEDEDEETCQGYYNCAGDIDLPGWCGGDTCFVDFGDGTCLCTELTLSTTLSSSTSSSGISSTISSTLTSTIPSSDSTSSTTEENSCPPCGYKEDDDQETCRGYINCRSGDNFPGLCGEGSCFDPDACFCVIETTTTDSSTGGANACPICGYREDDDDTTCQGYINCSTGENYPGACGGSDCFDPDACLCISSRDGTP